MIMFLLNMLTGDFQTSFFLLFYRNIINKCWIFHVPCVAERRFFTIRQAAIWLIDSMEGAVLDLHEVHGYLPNLVIYPLVIMGI